MPRGIKIVEQTGNEGNTDFEMKVMAALTAIAKFKPKIISAGIENHGHYYVIIRWIDEIESK